MKNTKIVALILTLISISSALCGCQIGNRQIGLDTKQTFDEAIIFTQHEIVSGDIESWRDFDDSDVVQVTIDGITYLTHYSNVILVRYDKEHQ